MKTKKNILVTLADKNYLDQAKQLFSSVYWNSGWQGDYMLLAHEIPEKDLKWFRDKGILVKECKPLISQGYCSNLHISAFDKFYLFTPEFKKWKNIIFLDADIIVRGQLDSLAHFRKMAVGRDVNPDLTTFELFSPSNKRERRLVYEALKIKERSPEPFNSGVLCFNSSIINSTLFERLISLKTRFDGIARCRDQLALNLFFTDVDLISLKYNYLAGYHPLRAVFESHINVLHFAGPHKTFKPWHRRNPFYNEWTRNLKNAESIDLRRFVVPKIKGQGFISKFILAIKIFLMRKSLLLDELLGRIGRFLRKYFPRIYHLLKKNEN